MELIELIELLEKATGPAFALDMAIARVVNPQATKHTAPPAYSASINAALTLVPDGWRMAALCQRDPWFCRLETDDFESVTWGKGGDWITEVTSGSEATANAATPALAIVIAAIRAIEARQQGEG